MRKKLTLVFFDWIKEESGDSVYFTRKGVELSFGDFHSGTCFDAEIEIEDYRDEFEISAENGIVPVFYAIIENAE